MQKIIKSFIFILFSVFSIVSIAKPHLPQETIYSKIGDKYLRSFNKPSFSREELKKAIDPQTNQLDEEVLKKILENKKTTLKNKAIVLDLFNQNQATKKEDKSLNKCIMSETLWQDLELFCGQHTIYSHLLSKINRTKTEAGTTILAKILAEPTTDITELKRRQNIIKELVENEEVFKQLDSALSKYAKAESDLLSFWDERNKATLFTPDFYYPPHPITVLPNSLLQKIFPYSVKNKFNQDPKWVGFLAFWNNAIAFQSIAQDVTSPPTSYKNACKSWEATTGYFGSLKTELTNLFGQTTASEKIGSFINSIGYSLATYWKFQGIGYNIGRIPFALTNAIKTAEQEKNKIITLKNAYSKLQSAAHSVNDLKDLNVIINTNSVLKENINCIEDVKHVIENTTSNCAEFDNLLNQLGSNSFKENDSPLISTLMNRGKILSTSYLMAKTQNKLVDILKVIGEIDAYLSIAKLYKELKNQNATYCFAKYIEQETPYISLQDFWTPFIDPQTVVINSIEIGKAHSKAVISGPNAGGKSTILKAIIINLLLAQTFGIAPAKNVVLTPFSYLDTYLNITDDISSGNSLFKSEVLRVKSLIETISSQKPNEFSFVIMDEIFSGTNPLEGEAAGYAIGKYLSAFKYNITMISSHFPKLTNLEQDTNGLFKNYKVSVVKKDDNSLEYPFKLEEGKTNQTIAIDILRAENFDPQIIKDAYAVMDAN